ncbi:MAG: PAS domain S-box protein [Bacteroidales bacterium]|nr:PAS domain S-box protein [Bacteroidales bacterium]
MKNNNKTNEQLLKEIDQLRARIAELEKSETERKQVEEARKKSEEKYSALYDNALVALFRVSLKDQKAIAANKVSAELFGYSSIEEFIKEFRSLKHYANLEDREPIISELKAKGYIDKIVLRTKKKDGTLIWNEASFRLNPEKGYVDCVLINITKRKQAEHMLLKKVAEMDSFINNIPDMAWLKDVNSNFIIANKAFGNAVGMDPEYLSNHTCAICFGEEAEKKFKEDDKRVLEIGKQIVIEESINDVKGNKVFLETIKSPIFNESGEVIGTVGIARDITERKQAEEKDKEQVKEFRLKNIVFECSITANSISDNNGIITHVNPEFFKIWGYNSIEEVIGKPISYFLKNEEEALEIVTALNKTGDWEGEYTGLKIDGSTFNAYGLATVVQNEKGENIGYQSAVLDITEQKKVEKELKKYRDHLEELVKERTKELEVKNKKLQENVEEFERYHKLFVEREFRIKELRDEIEELKKK